MIEDGTTFLGGPPLKTQVCIVGTGPAGITLAWYLLRQGIDVTLLEGSRSFNPGGPNAPVSNAYLYNENTLLYNGQSLGQFENNEPQFVIRPTSQYNQGAKERERIYGGTSTHWGGQARPLDPITFEKRPPNFPGWPITRADLDPYYAEACKFLQLYGDYYAQDGTAGYNFTAEFWAQELGESVADLAGFDVDMYQFVPGQNLQFQARQVDGQTIGESSARVILNASLLDIVHQGGSVSALTVGVMDDDRTAPKPLGTFTVNAEVYVLACGAVANARQLLLSNIGNRHDLVGRHLMGHPIASGADAISVPASSYLTPSEQRLLSYQSLGPKYAPVTTVTGLFTPNGEALRSLATGSCWIGSGGTDDFYHELIPEYKSRVSLTDTLDLFGQRQTKADWVLNDAEPENFRKLADLFKASVTAKGGGPVEIGSWDNILPRMAYNGHHIGTTRMAATEELGVVDQNLKVFAMDNLHVAGSSVWASPGISNPTFSIVTFSIRLADHLAQQLKGAAQER
jgi:choline dehydrogenase-like flavoprotein